MSLPGLKTVSVEWEGSTSLFLPLFFSKLFTKMFKCARGVDGSVVRIAPGEGHCSCLRRRGRMRSSRGSGWRGSWCSARSLPRRSVFTFLA